MKKQLALAAILALSLAACGDKPKDKPADTKAAAPATGAAAAGTCESAIKNLLKQYPQLGPINPTPPEGFAAKAEPGMVAACKQRQWKQAELDCLTKATDKGSATACYNKIDALDRAHAMEAAEAALKALGGAK